MSPRYKRLYGEKDTSIDQAALEASGESSRAVAVSKHVLSGHYSWSN